MREVERQIKVRAKLLRRKGAIVWGMGITKS
jgi:hypothetical protein